MNIISSTQKQPYIEFFAELLNKIEPYKINGIAVVALSDNENLMGYWNMNLKDKMIAKNEIELDCIDEMIMNNIDRYVNEYMNNGEDINNE